MMKTLALGVVLVTATGCATSTVGRDFNSEGVTQIKSGVTTEQQVLHMLGEPYDKTVSPGGDATWQYRYENWKASATPLTFIWATADTMYQDRVIKNVTVRFSKQIVVGCTYSYGAFSGSASQASVPMTTIPCGDR